ncbi:MAG: glycosyltransferase [Acetobacteraceae bacterium]|nr:glycosyltransferase [Acetobacteraceae bacterium]
MEVYGRSARDTLRLPDQAGAAASTPWAVFDPEWYRARYPDVPEGTAEEVLEWHLSLGQAQSHSPNRFFDEAWQRRAWPGIQDLIYAGSVTSAFDAWCRGPHTLRSPLWSFDPVEYQRRYPVLTEDVLAEAGLLDLYDHYLQFGAAEKRIGHALFDPIVYLVSLGPEEAAAAEANPFLHFLTGLDRGAPERRPSVLFDPDWYRDRYPDAVQAVAEGRYRTLLEHYLCNETPGEFDPSPWFSETWYLSRNPGVAKAAGPEGFRNGFAHFLAFGLEEGRSPHPGLDLAWYATQTEVQADLETGRARDAFSHWIAIGHAAGLSGLPPEEITLTAAQAIMLYQRKSAAIWPALVRYKLDFSHGGTPALSVVMAVRNHFAETLISLASLRAQFRGEIDLILIQSGPAIPGADIESHVTGATVLRFSTVLTDAAAREAGLVCASASMILFLGDGLELSPGALDAALARLAADPGIGAVGGRLVQPHGLLLEAGGIIWRDGSLQAYLQDESPLAPEANFVRGTDFCSTLFLMARREILSSLPEPAAGVAGTTHDAADLCARIHEAGFRVIFDPDALAFMTSLPDHRIPNGQAEFAAAHRDFLTAREDASPGAIVRARSPDRGRQRILFIEDSTPLRRIGSGFVRSNDIIRAMVASGADVTVFPMAASPFPLATIRAELPDTVEVMRDHTAADFAAFMEARRGAYDVIWVARTHNLDKIHETLEGAVRREARPPRIVVDTEAVASVRKAEQAAVTGQSFDLDAALRDEFTHLDQSMEVVAVTEAEAGIIRPRHMGPIAIVGHSIAASPTPAAFLERSGMLFAGAFHGMDHPNHDGLVWFIEEVLPLIEQALRWETRLTVAGYIAPGVTLDRFNAHPRVTLRGPVPDLTPLYNTHRVFVAPARFAAGIPYKVHEAAALGVPVVTTSLLARQLGWHDDDTIGAADATDAAGFATRVIALYRDSALWARRREAALARVAVELDPAAFTSRISDLVRRPNSNASVDGGLELVPGSVKPMEWLGTKSSNFWTI